MPNIGVINEQGFPFEDTGMGYTQLNESDQKTVDRDSTRNNNDQKDQKND